VTTVRTELPHWPYHVLNICRSLVLLTETQRL